MSLLDKASLCVTPNAYNEGVLYDVIPNTPLGDMDVVRATTATRVNSSNLIESVAVNVPRIDYTNGSCPSLLVEPQRTNLFLRSEQFTNASWIYSGGGASVFTDNFSISPNGTTTAARWTAANINSQVRQNVATINNTSTISIWMRTNSGTKTVNLFINDSAVQSTITVTATWQRFTLTGATGGTLLGAGRCGFSNNSVLTTSDYIEVWGAQYELGAYGTSYIPTVASTVTRNADVISKTGISSLIGQTEGVFYAEINGFLGENTARLLSIFNTSLGTYRNYINISLRNLTNLLRFTIAANGVTIRDFSTTVVQTNFNKIAVKYSQSGYSFWLNGVKVADGVTACNFQLLDRFTTSDVDGTSPFNGNIKSIQLYKTALTDAECIALTTL
jgi:hypothetical protein